MILYLLKSTAALAILWGIYKLFLEAEKMHVFNRFYLLASLVFAFTIPLVNIEIAPATENNTNFLAKTLEAQPALLYDTYHIKAVTPPEANAWLPYLIATFALVSVFFLFRFVYNLTSIYKKIKDKATIQWQGATLVLLEETTLPYTFLNFVFINKTHYTNAGIEQELFSHELAHVRQKHSVDVLLIEVLRIIFWFNPLLYLFKQAIQLNHEFLADEAVNTVYQDVRAYQYLLLSKATEASGLSLTSNLNFQITKKRLLMMTKMTSESAAFIRKAACAPLFIAIGFCLANFQLIAQEPTTLKLSAPEITLELQTPKLTLADVDLKNANIYIRRKDKNTVQKKYSELTEEEKNNHIKLLYEEVLIPTPELMEKWKDSKIYGMWIDGKRVPNHTISKYKPNDISNYWASRVLKNATNYGKHKYQLNIMTNDYYHNVYIKGVKIKPLIFIDQTIKN